MKKLSTKLRYQGFVVHGRFFAPHGRITLLVSRTTSKSRPAPLEHGKGRYDRIVFTVKGLKHVRRRLFHQVLSMTSIHRKVQPRPDIVAGSAVLATARPQSSSATDHVPCTKVRSLWAKLRATFPER